MPDQDAARPDPATAMANQALRRVVHDLNSPLAAIAMAAAALRTATDDQQRERLIAIVEQQALRAGRIATASTEPAGAGDPGDEPDDGRSTAARGCDPGSASADSGRDRGLALVVDDDEAVRALLVLALRHDGWRVIAVGDGGAAQAAADQQPPDLVLLDVHLGDESGRDLADRLVAHDGRLGGRIIYLSGDPVADGEPDGHPALRKPFALADLRELADRLAPRQP